MPLVAMRIQNDLFLIEKIKGLDYSLLASFLQGKLSESQEWQRITKEELKQVLTLTKSVRKRVYTVCSVQGIRYIADKHINGLD